MKFHSSEASCSPSHFEKVSQRCLHRKNSRNGCSPSHFEKVSQLHKGACHRKQRCSPSHFEKVSQLRLFLLILLQAVRLRISRRFHSGKNNCRWPKHAVRLRISRRFHSRIEGDIDDEFSCSPSHFEKVSQRRPPVRRDVHAVRLRISRRFHSRSSTMSTRSSAVRLRISRRFHSSSAFLCSSVSLFAFAFREGFTAKNGLL